MSETPTIALDAPDPLGLRRCPNCLYDRFGLADGRPCPECGYVLPAAVVVLTLPRVRRIWPTWLGVAAAIVALAVAVVAAFPPALLGALVVFAAYVIGIAILRSARRAESPDAFAPQIWLHPDGIGVVRDADRSAFLGWLERFVERASVLLAIGGSIGIVLGPRFTDDRGAAIGVLCGVLARSIRNAFRSRVLRDRAAVDAIGPRLTSWRHVSEILVDPEWPGTFRVKMTLRWFGFRPTETIEFESDVHLAAAARSLISERAPRQVI